MSSLKKISVNVSQTPIYFFAIFVCMFMVTVLFTVTTTIVIIYVLSCPTTEGWAIPKKHLHKKSLIGKGEFGGTFYVITLN